MAKTAYIIAGPTAVGKTAVSIQLATRLATEIISADSRQCYKEMSIGTAKPGADELSCIKHYFIDEFSVVDSLTAADFETLALNYIVQIFEKHDTAVVCGGTGLYIKALCDGLDDMPPVSEDIVQSVNEEYETKGLSWLQRAVQEEDPDFYATGEIKNPARLLRALIFKRSVGESISAFKSGQKKQRDFNVIKAGIELPREQLYDRINKRVDTMMQQGLLEEVKKLYPMRKLKNLQTVGYTELFDYLEGNYTLEEAVEKIKQNTRNYAKRQMTWFKKDKDIVWFDANDEHIIDKILNL